MGKTTRLTTEQFIEKARVIHGDKYGYDEVDYINSRTKVKIWCNIHKEYFYQNPRYHLEGQACKKCSIEIRKNKQCMTQEEFVNRAKKVHSDKYRYTDSEYVNSKTKVKIWCNTHKEYFYQIPATHLKGGGCFKCGVDLLKGKKPSNTLTTSEFIEKAIYIHGNVYDYTFVEYKTSHIKVDIKCKKHNLIFQQIPNSHLRGRGCPQCGNEKIKEFFSDTKDSFIEKAEIVHKDKYDYSKVMYKDSTTKVDIKCKKHNKYFSQIPSDHLSGKGCPQCRKDSFDKHYTERYKDTPTMFYVIKYKGLYKIGITIQGSPLERYKAEVDDISEIEVLHTINFDSAVPAYELEQNVQINYSHLKYRGKHIFKQTRNTEVYTENIYELYVKEQGLLYG